MAFLTIAGTDWNVVSIDEDEPDRVGDWGRSFNGTLRSSIRASKRAWQITLDEVNETNYLNLKSDIGDGLHITITGDAFDGSFTGVVFLRRGRYVRRSTSFNVQPELTIIEV